MNLTQAGTAAVRPASDSRLGARVRGRIGAWLARKGGPEAAPIVLTQRRIYVLPTRPGLFFALALLAMLLGAINYQLSLGFALTFLLAGLGHSAILHTFRNLVRLEVEPGATPPVACGELARFHLRLVNRRDTPRYALTLRVGEECTHVDEIAPNTTALADIVVPATRRGWLRLPRVTLDTRFPLGLIHAWSYVQPDMRVLVWPRPENSPPPLPLGGGRFSGAASNARGNDDFAGLRAYQSGDSLRHIAWKAAAGGGPLMTKHFSGFEAGEAELRWSALPAQMDVEARLSRLAAWVLRADANGMGWRLELPGTSLGPAHGGGHRDACLKALALFGQAGEET